MKRAWLPIVAVLLASAAYPRSSTKGNPSDHFHWRPSAHAVGSAILLPGSGGLRVIDDDHHYFDVAARLNEAGWSALVVDYKAAYRASANAPEGTTAEKIAWVTAQAVSWLGREHPEATALPGAVLAWSLGAEGAIALANEPSKLGAFDLRGVGLYYPANQSRARLVNRVPMLIVTGEADDIVPVSEVRAMVDGRGEGAALVDLHVYPSAVHGFDVASLTRRKTIRAMPLFGKKATLQYDEAAARDARSRVAEFLAERAAR